jgi:hypothetical protein
MDLGKPTPTASLKMPKVIPFAAAENFSSRLWEPSTLGFQFVSLRSYMEYNQQTFNQSSVCNAPAESEVEFSHMLKNFDEILTQFLVCKCFHGVRSATLKEACDSRFGDALGCCCCARQTTKT